MEPNAFIGKEAAPTDADLSDVLGASKAVWDRLIADLADQHGVTGREWKSYSKKAGWSLRLLKGKRTIAWLGACCNGFRAAFVLGDKAVLAAKASALGPEVIQIIDESVKYAEGTGVRLHVRTVDDLAPVMILAQIKIEN